MSIGIGSGTQTVPGTQNSSLRLCTMSILIEPGGTHNYGRYPDMDV